MYLGDPTPVLKTILQASARPIFTKGQTCHVTSLLKSPQWISVALRMKTKTLNVAWEIL